jgi:hypothetical protein
MPSPSQPLQPFSILKYQPNPAFFQPNQAITISPITGFSAVSYVLSSGTLPSGVTLNATTGIISGSSSSTVPATMVTVTATLANSTTTSTNVWLSVIDIPETALNANQNTTNFASSNRLILEQNFLSDLSAMIINNSQLGLFYTYVNVPMGASMLALQTYLTSLNYVFCILYPSQNVYDFTSQFGGLPDYAQYPDFTQPYPITANISQDSRKVLVSWSDNSCPYWLWPYYYYGAYPTSCS